MSTITGSAAVSGDDSPCTGAVWKGRRLEFFDRPHPLEQPAAREALQL